MANRNAEKEKNEQFFFQMLPNGLLKIIIILVENEEKTSEDRLPKAYGQQKNEPKHH